MFSTVELHGSSGDSEEASGFCSRQSISLELHYQEQKTYSDQSFVDILLRTGLCHDKSREDRILVQYEGDGAHLL